MVLRLIFAGKIIEMEKRKICIARGDGIGPEIMDATLRVLEASGAPVAYDEIKVGKAVYEAGHSSGLEPDAWNKIRESKVLLKAPITTPQGGGYKSLNVTLRKMLSLYANIRPCVAYHPYVFTRHAKMDTVIVRENEEDLYGGIEYQQSSEVTQALKLISRPGSERIIRFAFEYARHYKREKVTCFSKDNIMKLTDGLFHKTFDRIAAEYPEIEADHMIIDIGSARLADTPEFFDVIVTENLYGDIISDIAAQIAGSVGLAGSSNIGRNYAMFEAIHGSAPDIAGQNKANPSGLLLAAVQMLVHIGLNEHATRIHNAWLRTIEDGIHTADIYDTYTSTRLVGTREFAEAVVERLDMQPRKLTVVDYAGSGTMTVPEADPTPRAEKKLVGVDIFLDWDEENRDANRLAAMLDRCRVAALKMQIITNRGTKVYPDGFPETYHSDHWRIRFATDDYAEVSPNDIIDLQRQVLACGLDLIKTENLYLLDGVPGFSLGQGE